MADTQGVAVSGIFPSHGTFRIPAALVLFLAAMAPVCAIAPRAMAFLPPMAGLLGFTALYFFRKVAQTKISFLPLALCAAPVALGAFSLLWADDPGQAFARAWKIALTLLPGGLLLSVLPVLVSGTVRQKLSLFFPACVGAGALALGTDLALGLPVLRALAGVPEGVEFDPFHANRGIVVLSLLFFPALEILLTQEKSFRFRVGSIAALCAAVVFMLCEGESQSAQMAFALGLAIVLLFPVRIKAAWAGAGAMLCAAIISAPWIARALFGHFSGMLTVMREANISPRLEIWDFVARRALEHPFFGYGIEATRRQVFDTAQLYFQGNTVLHPHNFALQLWMEFGAFGALCGAAFLCFILRRIYLLPPRSARFSLAAFVAALSVGATGYGLWQAWWLGSLILVAAWCLIARREQHP